MHTNFKSLMDFHCCMVGAVGDLRTLWCSKLPRYSQYTPVTRYHIMAKARKPTDVS